jgi:hypothetical protein
MSASSKSKVPKTHPRPPLGETRLVACTVKQIEERNPGVQGRLRAWIHRADRGDPEFAGLRVAIIRVGRSVLVDELRFVEFLRQRSLIPPAPDRRHGSNWVREGGSR